MRRPSAGWAAPALWLVIIALAAWAVSANADAASRRSHGFASYYSAAVLVSAGQDVGRFYDDEWYAAQVERQVPGVRDVFRPNPPTLAVVLAPLAALDYGVARLLWTAAGLLCLALVCLLLARSALLPGPWLPGFLALCLLYQPLHANLQQAQSYLFLLALLSLAWLGYRRRRAALTGVTLGLMLSLKLAGPLLWPLLLLQRRWRALAWGAATALLCAVATLPLSGASAWARFGEVLASAGSLPERSVTAYQTQLSLLRHLLAYDRRWNPAPLLDAPLAALWLPWLISVVVLGLSLYWARAAEEPDLAFAAMTIAGVVLSPFSLDYHYTLLLLPIAIIAADLRGHGGAAGWATLALAVALIASDLPYRSPRLAAGAWALLAYPKLYGALLLWGLALAGCRGGQRVSDIGREGLPALRRIIAR